MNEPAEEEVLAAESVKRREYESSVRAIAQYIVDDEECDREDRIHETCGGSYWVIYTHANFDCLRWSPNDGAFFDEHGDSVLTNDGAGAFAVLAYHAIVADVREEIERIKS